MPRPEKAQRREAKRDKSRKMRVSGRGLITDVPNVERRYKKEWERKKRT
jgi:hypothetical protein